MDYSKLVLEMTTPAYVEYFHELPAATRDELVAPAGVLRVGHAGFHKPEHRAD